MQFKLNNYSKECLIFESLISDGKGNPKILLIPIFNKLRIWFMKPKRINSGTGNSFKLLKVPGLTILKQCPGATLPALPAR